MYVHVQEMQLVQSIGWKLIQLQRAGNTHYFGWSVRFSCKMIKQEVLKKWLSKLSVELDNWNEQVKQARRKYYHLNNFTNKQLCTIRKFLCMAKSTSASPRSSVNPRILAMLQSIAAELSSEQIWHSTHIALQTISNAKGAGNAVVPQNDTSNKSLLPNTNVIEGMLSEKQQEVLKYLTTKCGFSEDIAQEAVQKHGDNENDAYIYCRQKVLHSQFEEGVSLDSFSVQSEESMLSEKQQEVLKYLTTKCGFSEDIAQEAVQKHGDNENDAYIYCRQKVLHSQFEEGVSLDSFSVQSEESSLRVDYHMTRKHFDKMLAAKWPQSISEPQSSSTRVEQTALDPDDADGVV